MKIKIQKISKLAQISERKRKMAAVAVITLIMCLIAAGGDDEGEISDGKLIRPKNSEGQISVNISVSGEGEDEDCTFDITVNPRKFTRDEVIENFGRAEEHLINNMLGENISFDKVSTNLKLITEFPEYSITVDWYSSDYELISYDGTVTPNNIPDSGEEVLLTAVMKCGEYEAEHVFNVNVIKPDLTDREEFLNDVYNAVGAALKTGEYEESIELPQNVNGRKIKYSQKRQSSVPTIAAGGLLAAAAIILSEKENKRKAEKMRIKQLQYAYSEVVSKLTLLIGAGMSVQRAWEKIALDYEKKRQKPECPAYEEMLITLRQIQSGVPEKSAYAEFGRRCGTKEYRKLGTLLEQNVRKGTKGLSELLEQESTEAFEQRKNLARQMGEEAGTKLLLPMILMLVIVMVIIMVPAVMSFQI